MVWSPPITSGAAPAAERPRKNSAIAAIEPSLSIGSTGASPTSATWHRSNGATPVATLTGRRNRDASRTCAGPVRAPGRIHVPRS